jgi:hypothetical protein
MSSSPNERNCRFILLSDDPSTEDLFGGPHDRVATAIVELIQSQAESNKVHGTTSIALEGTWGSGKSTVIRLVSRKLEAATNYLPIEFDAWAHEGDPLRRTFLEGIAGKLRERSWITEPIKEQLRERISKRVRDTETETTSRPTKLGFFLSLSLLLIPLGSALVTSAIRGGDIYTWNPDLPLSKQLTIGTFFAISPFLVMLWHFVVYLIGWTWLIGNVRAWWLNRRDAKAALANRDADNVTSNGAGPAKVKKRQLIPITRIFNLAYWPIFARHDSKNEKSRTIESHNPTSVEFEYEFEQLMETAIEGRDRRLILIMDNLDRVSVRNALAIWSTMQTFLHPASNGQTSWHKQLTVIVPYDPSGMMKVWQTNAITESGRSDESAESFLDKSFQVRFRVPPPVLSTWQDYLDSLLVEALPDLSEAERRGICRTVSVCGNDVGEQQSETPTPRQLKLYVNQLGALLRQWAYTFPVEHVTYFVLNCCANDEKSVADRIRDNVLPGKKGEQLYGREPLIRTIASLYYNEQPDLAMQLLLAPQIINSMIERRPDELKGLAEQYGNGFWLILQELGTQTPFQISGRHVCSAAGTLSESAIEVEHRKEFEIFVNRLSENVDLDFLTELPAEAGLYQDIGFLCRLKADQEFTGEVHRWVTDRLAMDSDYSELFVDCIVGFDKSLNGEYPQDTPFKLPATAEMWVPVCERAVAIQAPERVLRLLRPDVTDENVDEYLALAFTATCPKGLVDCIAVSKQSFPGYSWPHLVSMIKASFAEDKQIKAEDAKGFLAILCDLSRTSGDADAALRGLVTDGQLYHQLHRLRKEKALLRYSVFLHLLYRPDGDRPASLPGHGANGFDMVESCLASPDEGDVKAVIDLAAKFDRCSFLIEVLTQSYGTLPTLVVDAVQTAMKADNWQDFFRYDDIKNHFAKLSDVFTSDEYASYARRIQELVDDGTLQQNLEASDLQLSDIPFICHVLKCVNAQSTDWLPTWCADQLQKLSVSDWVNSTATDFAPFVLLADIVQIGTSITLRTPFADALRTHASKVANGESVPGEPIRGFWRSLAACITENSIRRDMQRLIAKDILQTDGDISPQFFELYGDAVEDAIELISSESRIAELFVPIVRSKKIENIEWLVGLLEKRRGLIDAHSTDAALWVERLTDELNSDEITNDLRDKLIELAQLSGVSIPDTTGQESTDSDQGE